MIFAEVIRRSRDLARQGKFDEINLSDFGYAVARLQHIGSGGAAWQDEPSPAEARDLLASLGKSWGRGRVPDARVVRLEHPDRLRSRQAENAKLYLEARRLARRRASFGKCNAEEQVRIEQRELLTLLRKHRPDYRSLPDAQAAVRDVWAETTVLFVRAHERPASASPNAIPKRGAVREAKALRAKQRGDDVAWCYFGSKPLPRELASIRRLRAHLGLISRSTHMRRQQAKHYARRGGAPFSGSLAT